MHFPRNSHRRGGRRLTALAARWQIAAALLFVALAALFATTAQAQTATVPDEPTGLTATAKGETRIDLSWTAPADDGGATISGYRIQFARQGNSIFNNLVADTGSTDTTYSHTGLSAGTIRIYRVSAINSVGVGSPSNSAGATTAGRRPARQQHRADLAF